MAALVETDHCPIYTQSFKEESISQALAVSLWEHSRWVDPVGIGLWRAGSWIEVRKMMPPLERFVWNGPVTAMVPRSIISIRNKQKSTNVGKDNVLFGGCDDISLAKEQRGRW
ncbi:hypothetical protein QCA50_002556 [Cerrena zonata]|uniref:Uncharacterized protein n=1 Tax=Cerrena zonata TaxID=2478898 RepID=A0AAW0FG25_9APHY